jgi:hypothetical protein
MNSELLMDYIKQRCEELGIKQYNYRLRHYVLPPKGKTFISAANQLFILTEPTEMVLINSDSGVYDLSTGNSNELQYEHKGEINMQNYSSVIRHIIFVQVIPKTL